MALIPVIKFDQVPVALAKDIAKRELEQAARAARKRRIPRTPQGRTAGRANGKGVKP
jgi:hypothetical protein